MLFDGGAQLQVRIRLNYVAVAHLARVAKGNDKRARRKESGLLLKKGFHVAEVLIHRVSVKHRLNLVEEVSSAASVEEFVLFWEVDDDDVADKECILIRALRLENADSKLSLLLNGGQDLCFSDFGEVAIPVFLHLIVEVSPIISIQIGSSVTYLLRSRHADHVTLIHYIGA